MKRKFTVVRPGGAAPVTTLARIAHIRYAASASSRRIVRRIQRSPHTAICSTSGCSSSPAWVSTYSLPRCSITPTASSVRSRLVSSDDDISGTPRWMSLNRRLPSTSSRITSGVQRSVSTSAVAAIGQNWP